MEPQTSVIPDSVLEWIGKLWALAVAVGLVYGLWRLGQRIARWYAYEKANTREVWDQRWGQLISELENEINPLPIDEAVRRTEALLRDRSKVECWEEPPTEAERVRLAPLAPGLRAFFERYSGVESVRGGTQIVRMMIEPSESGPPNIRIGLDDDHSDIGVKPGEETIYAFGATFPSIYHFLLYNDREEAFIQSSADYFKLRQAQSLLGYGRT
jgi:hypothetical protein